METEKIELKENQEICENTPISEVFGQNSEDFGQKTLKNLKKIKKELGRDLPLLHGQPWRETYQKIRALQKAIDDLENQTQPNNIDNK